MEQPEWLRRISYGLSDAKKNIVLAENDHSAIVKLPGGFWSDNGGRHYGEVSYMLVRKDARASVGLIEGKELQSGGRVGKKKLAEWSKLLEGDLSK